jgi:pimeloyl-ACP methyl ester carboxylesterase
VRPRTRALGLVRRLPAAVVSAAAALVVVVGYPDPAVGAADHGTWTGTVTLDGRLNGALPINNSGKQGTGTHHFQFHEEWEVIDSRSTSDIFNWALRLRQRYNASYSLREEYDAERLYLCEGNPLPDTRVLIESRLEGERTRETLPWTFLVDPQTGDARLNFPNLLYSPSGTGTLSEKIWVCSGPEDESRSFNDSTTSLVQLGHRTWLPLDSSAPIGRRGIPTEIRGSREFPARADAHSLSGGDTQYIHGSVKVKWGLRWTPAPKNPIIFIHGFLGSRIACGENELWPALLTLNPVWLHMQLAPDGISNFPGPCSGIAGPTGLLETVGPKPVYRSTVDFLRRIAPHDHDVYFWDWRKSPELAIGKLDRLVDEARAKAGGRKVVLMAHSMGGLVTRWYIDDPGRASKVARAVTVGAPYWGSPKALFPLAAGVETPIPSLFDALLYPNSHVRQFARNLQGLYFLWPSPSYGNWLWHGQQPAPLDRAELLTFVSDTLNGNSALLARALDEHTAYLDHLKTNGVDYQVVAGTGLDTIVAVEITPLGNGDARYHINWGNGDETVALKSATLGGSLPPGRLHFVCGVEHAELPGHPRVTTRIEDFVLEGRPISGSENKCPPPGNEDVSFRLDLGG